MTCEFTLTRGPRRGQPCGGSVRSGTMCRRHHLMIARRNRLVAPPRPQQDYQDDLGLLVERIEQRFRISEPEEQKELVYEPCPMCFSQVDGAKVTLDCGCEYHLNCYLIIQNEPNCIKCNDKINKTEEDYKECSICLDTIKKNGKKTKCGHHFHKKCIKQWRRIKHNCPNCRAHI